MKNAKQYEKAIKKLLNDIKKTAGAPTSETDPVLVMLEALLQSDAPRKGAAKALGALQKEFVDLNELRVAPTKDVVDTIGREYPCPRERAQMITHSLNSIFDRSSAVSMDYLKKMPKRELRQCLMEVGLNHFAAAVVVMQCYGGHAVAVDQTLLECLQADGYVGPDADIPDAQGFLERIIPQKEDFAAHELLRDYAEKAVKALPKKPRLELAEFLTAPPPAPRDYKSPPPLPEGELDEDDEGVVENGDVIKEAGRAAAAAAKKAKKPAGKPTGRPVGRPRKK